MRIAPCFSPVAVALALIVGTALPSQADSEKNQKRQNLVDLALAPDDYIGQTKRVFCPIEVAQVDAVTCYVLNERLQTVGDAMIFIEGVPASEYTPILNRCAGGYGRNVGDDCAFEIDVFVSGEKGSTSLEAKKFYPIH